MLNKLFIKYSDCIGCRQCNNHITSVTCHALRHYNAKHPDAGFDAVRSLTECSVHFRGELWYHINFWARSRRSNKIKRFFAEVHYKPPSRSSVKVHYSDPPTGLSARTHLFQPQKLRCMTGHWLVPLSAWINQFQSQKLRCATGHQPPTISIQFYPKSPSLTYAPSSKSRLNATEGAVLFVLAARTFCTLGVAVSLFVEMTRTGLCSNSISLRTSTRQGMSCHSLGVNKSKIHVRSLNLA